MWEPPRIHSAGVGPKQACQLQERSLPAGAAPFHEGRLFCTKAPPRNHCEGAVFEDEKRAFPPGAQIGDLFRYVHMSRLWVEIFSNFA
jgi:hypothetical protein